MEVFGKIIDVFARMDGFVQFILIIAFMAFAITIFTIPFRYLSIIIRGYPKCFCNKIEDEDDDE